MKNKLGFREKVLANVGPIREPLEYLPDSQHVDLLEGWLCRLPIITNVPINV